MTYAKNAKTSPSNRIMAERAKLSTILFLPDLEFCPPYL